MTKYKTQFDMARDLMNMLHTANMADTNDSEFTHENSRQDNLFGNLAEALKNLGYEWAYDYYCENGERPIIFQLCEEFEV